MAKFVAIGVKNILTPQGVRFLIGLYRPALNKDLAA